MNLRFNLIYWLLPALLLACRKEPSAFIPDNDNGRTNKWMADSMRRYYYWSSDIPPHPDYTLSPPDFFNSLLSVKDRFSRISNQDDVGMDKSSMDLYGFHYSVVQHPALPAQLLGVVMLTAPESPAVRAGLVRGTCFTRVNELPLIAANLEKIHTLLSSGKRIALTPAVQEAGHWKEQPVVTIDAAFVHTGGVYTRRIFQVNGHKTGYLFYNGFTESDDLFLLEAMALLKTAGISDLILDLRYNPGGSMATAAKLGAMLAPVSKLNEVFVVCRGNRNGGTVMQTFADAIRYSGNSYGRHPDELRVHNPGISRVYILTGRYTASSAELLINCLRPYMTVVKIGERTLGKDEAVFKITGPDTRWVLMPTIYKLLNARQEGGYDTGIPPDETVKELDHFPPVPPGDAGDPLIARALQLIYGNEKPVGETFRKKRLPVAVIPVFHSAETGAARLPVEVYRRP